MKYIKFSSAIAAGLFMWLAAPAYAQTYGNDTPIGNDTPEQAMAWAIGFCQVNSLEYLGYSSYQQCVTDIFNQTTPTGLSVGADNTSYLIELPSGGTTYRFYGQAPGRIGSGG